MGKNINTTIFVPINTVLKFSLKLSNDLQARLRRALLFRSKRVRFKNDFKNL